MIRLHLNGQDRDIGSDPDTPLLYVLRDELGLNGSKFGCGLGQCGACTVIVDGKAVFSCLMPVALLAGRRVRTIEGLGSPASPNAVQRAFIAEQAAQCGYCIAGMVMRAQALLEHNPHPSEREIRETMAVNLCRCGTHMRILAAVRQAAAGQRSAGLDQAALAQPTVPGLAAAGVSGKP
ncbi:(2Fe-2S)-binding protein [Rhodopila sp.]|uniref:(2Fe-2S)-binding protein n=1 Tax=Rhodopila sp. TaxID=2480087 RepID=UPI003D153541